LRDTVEGKKKRERLTERKLFYGEVLYNCEEYERSCDRNCLDKTCKVLRESAKRLKEYEDLEEQGKLLKKWTPAEEPPADEGYILLSFENFGIPLVGRYEEDEEGGGIFYLGDEEASCISQDLIVNAWMPLPEPYEEI